MTRHGIPAVTTRVARAGWDEHWYRGHRVFAELVGSESLAGLSALAVTGKRLSAAEASVLDDIATAWIAADARIWPLKVTRLAASWGSLAHGLAAGMLTLDTRSVGMLHTTTGAGRFLTAVRHKAGDGADAGQFDSQLLLLLEQTPHPPGFGVPFREVDERVAPMRSCLERRQRHVLPYWTLFERVADAIFRLRGLRPNAASAFAAACLDLGFESQELGPVAVGLAFHGFLAHAVEGAAQQHPALQRLPANCVRYVGAARRLSPRAGAR